MNRMKGVHVSLARSRGRSTWVSVSDLCREDHDYESRGMYAHKCPVLALQRAIKARGYHVERYEDTLFVRTTYKQYARLFYRLQQAVVAKYEAWGNRAAVVDLWSNTHRTAAQMNNRVRWFKSEAEASAFIGTLPDAAAGRYQIDVNGAAAGLVSRRVG